MNVRGNCRPIPAGTCTKAGLGTGKVSVVSPISWDALLLLVPFPLIVWAADELWGSRQRAKAEQDARAGAR